MSLQEDEGLELTLPASAKLVGVGMIPDTDHHLGFWFELDPELEPSETRTFMVRGTGQPIEDDWNHRCTLRDGEFMWHVYEYNYG